MAASVLYHYTSLENFTRIIRTARIRATHYLHLDDTHEVQLGAEQLFAAVKAHKADDSSGAFQAYLITAIDKFTTSKLEVYVLSLTDAMDSETPREDQVAQ